MCRRFLFFVTVVLLLSSVGSATVGQAETNAMVASSLAVSTGRVGSAIGQSTATVGHSRQGYSYASVSAESTAVVGAGNVAYSHSSATAVAQQQCVVGPRRRMIWRRHWLLLRHLFWWACPPPCPPSPPPCPPDPQPCPPCPPCPPIPPGCLCW
jgi:hypothetical protein